GVEAGDEVEAVIAPWQPLHFTDAEIRVWKALAGEGDQRLGCIEPVRPAATFHDEAQERADAAADVEDPPFRFEPGSLERPLVRRELSILAQRPVGRTRSPEWAPPGRAPGYGGCGHVRSFQLDYDP